MENPFAQGESRLIRPPSTAFVLFGATGDLAHRKLIPALYNLACDEYLPVKFLVLGVARSKLSDKEYRESLYESVQKYSRREIKKSLWNEFAKGIYYQPLHADQPDSYQQLKARLEKFCDQGGEDYNYLYYLATAPRFFSVIASQLKDAGLVNQVASDLKATSIVVEKPYGHNLISAQELNTTLCQSFDEQQIFRIDHYLGKETVQNILVFRFANGIFEPLWNHHYIDHIQISVSETVGVGERAGYFDRSGIVRDMLQNHLLQMLSLICIEPPHSLSDANSIRDEKVKVLRSLKRYTPEEVETHTVRAQYTSGYVNGEQVLGYLEEDGVAPQSQTETFCAFQVEIDNWRWSGVPIYLRVGKRLPKRVTEIAMVFKKPPLSLFQGRLVSELAENVLRIQIQPNESISLTMNSKPPGPRMRVGPVCMDFQYDESFGVASPDAYERLLLDAMRGDATLFTRNDEIEQAWDFLEPVLQSWSSPDISPVQEYQAGSWGPAAADTLLQSVERCWRRL